MWKVETRAGEGDAWASVGDDQKFGDRAAALAEITDIRDKLPESVRYRVRYRVRLAAPQGDLIDIRGLIKARGAEEVSEVLGTTPRNLVDLRGGFTALTIDDLYALNNAYPDFDMTRTITRLGEKRIQKGRARVTR